MPRRTPTIFAAALVGACLSACVGAREERGGPPESAHAPENGNKNENEDEDKNKNKDKDKNAEPGEEEDKSAGADADAEKGPHEVVDAAASGTSPPLFVGRWLMTSEEPADGLGGAYEQKWRRMELRADGTFHSENYVQQGEGTWTYDGKVFRTGKDEFVLERVSEDVLVLVEPLPKIYTRDGPARKVRNTYRRISESELGPMLGAKVTTSTPRAGSYAGSYAYRMSKYPTMEIHVGKTITGHARLALGDDKTVNGCIAVAVDGSTSTSHFASRDGKDHRSNESERTLRGVRGTWVIKEDKALVTIDRFWRDTCDTGSSEGDVMGTIELECTMIAATNKLPIPALACLIVDGHSGIREIALNPADTERSGPFTLQSDPLGHINTDHGRPWIFLGGGSGLNVESADDRETRGPSVRFSKGASSLVEANFRPRPELAD